MSQVDNATHIHKQAFLVSNLVLFVICIISTCTRLYVRIFVQKQFAIDDGILLFGVGCLICAMALLYNFADEMYLVGAVEAGMTGIKIPPDFILQAFYYHKMGTISLILTWCSIVSVKFIYLVIFKKLIDRIRSMLIYWWFVAVFNAIISAYGIAIYIAACPYFYQARSLQCALGSGLEKTISFAVSQMVLDIIGDFLILFIPIRLIWRIKVRWTQKLALSVSLCLTILTIMCTITRVSRIRTGRTIKSIDSIWETYWQFIAANLALIMTAATAFRTFFIAKSKDRGAQVPKSGYSSWYIKGRRLLRSALIPRSWQSRRSKDQYSSGDISHADVPVVFAARIPHGTMTGIRTFIHSAGRKKSEKSQVMHSMVEEEEYPDSVHLPTNGSRDLVIKVQRDMTFRSDEAC